MTCRVSATLSSPCLSSDARVCADCQGMLGPSPGHFLLAIGGFVMSSFMLPLSVCVIVLGLLYLLLGLFLMNFPTLVVGLAMLPAGRFMMAASRQGLRLRLQRGLHYCEARSSLVAEPADPAIRLLALAVLGAGTWALGALAVRSWLLSHFQADVLAACLSPLWALLSLLYAKTMVDVIRGSF